MSVFQVPVTADFSWQAPVLDKDLTVPPVSPTLGDRYIVGPSSTGAWATHDDEIAIYDGAAWVFIIPGAGWNTFVEDIASYYRFTGSAWQIQSVGGDPLTVGIIYGSDLASGDLTLESTSHASKGTIFIQPNGGDTIMGNIAANGAPLTVKTITGEGIRVSESATQYISIHENDGSSHVIEAFGNVPLRIKNNATTFGIQFLVNGGGVYIDKDGQLGINNTVPGAALDCNGSAIFNESGLDVDFRVESVNETNMLFVDAAEDAVCVGTPNQGGRLTIEAKAISTYPLFIKGEHTNLIVGVFEDGLGFGVLQVCDEVGNIDIEFKSNGPSWITEVTGFGFGTKDPQQAVHIFGDGAKLRLGAGVSGTNFDNEIEFCEGSDGSGVMTVGFRIFNTAAANEFLGIHAFSAIDLGGIDIHRDTGNVGVGKTLPTSQLYVDQSSSTAAEPVLTLAQSDISEEMIEFVTTVGEGNPVEAVGAKTFTPTHFVKVKVDGVIRHMQAGTIA